MPIGPEAYRSVRPTDDLSSGDIAYLSATRTRQTGEQPPGQTYDPSGRIPAYPESSVIRLPNEQEIVLDAMLALVVTHSCEIDRQKNLDVDAAHYDCRLTVAPIVSENNVRLIGVGSEGGGRDDQQEANWAAIAENAPVASLYLPPMPDLATIDPELEHVPWPRAFADLRGLATVSRRVVETDRLMALDPAYVGVLQRQLARFFTWRDIARHEVVEDLVGRRIVSATPLNSKGDRLRVALTADDGTSLTVEMRAR